jgi:hypothetical protein
MRAISAFLAAVVVSVMPAMAQTAAVETQLRVATAVQDALAWTGHMDALADGELGRRTVTGIEAFQQSRKWRATGDLSAEQKVDLLIAADAVRKKYGFAIGPDPRTNVVVGLPLGVVRDEGPSERGSKYASPDGKVKIWVTRYRSTETSLRRLFDDVVAEYPLDIVALKLLRRDAFFYAGDREGSDRYFTARIDGSGIAGLSVIIPSDRRDEWGRVVVAMANAFHKPIPNYAEVANILLPQRPPEVAGYVQRAPQGQPTSATAAYVRRDDLMMLASKLLEGAGITAYKFLPQRYESQLEWAYADGGFGSLAISRADSKTTISSAAGATTRVYTETCDGQISSQFQPAEYFKGIERRRLTMLCERATHSTFHEFLFIENSDGSVTQLGWVRHFNPKQEKAPEKPDTARKVEKGLGA